MQVIRLILCIGCFVGIVCGIKKHISELTLIKRESITRCITCYVIQRNDVDRFQPSKIDLTYRNAVKNAIDAGVEIITLVVSWNREGEVYFIRDDLPITAFN